MDQTFSTIAAQVAHADCVNALANKALRPGTVVIDLGAGDGEWARAAITSVVGLVVHCFEPDPVRYQQLLDNLASQINAGQVVPHNATAGWRDERGKTSWPSLQHYASGAGLTRLPFVHLGPEVPITAIAEGCSDLIRRGYIEFILATADAEEEALLARLLSPWRYELFRHAALGNQVLCACDRFRSTINSQQPQMPGVIELCQEFNITPKGVTHVGAHEGGEVRLYQSAGIARSLMIEANPAVYARMKAKVAGLEGVVAVNCAASDRNGTVDLHVTSFDQSSSILPLARHSAIYPSIKEVGVVQVPAKTIDQIVREAGHQPADYDLLNLDIQGAELMALKGAIGMLANVTAILTEVNFEELYAGCAMIEQMDTFLEEQGFDRVATATPLHASWGDAFYLRRRPGPVSRQAVTDFLHNARNTIVGGWLNIPTVSLREAWEGATGHAHRHLIENGVHQLPLAGDDDIRVLELLKTSLKTASKDRRLQLFLALMLYQPVSQIAVSPDGIPGWLKKSLPGLGSEQVAMAA